MTKEKLYRDTVHLQGLNIFNAREKAKMPRKEELEIKHQQIPNTNQRETFTTFLSQDKNEINNALSMLSEKMLVSERCRTVNRVPKYRIIKTEVVRAN